MCQERRTEDLLKQDTENLKKFFKFTTMLNIHDERKRVAKEIREKTAALYVVGFLNNKEEK